jgi:hypothetical protein
VDVILRDLSSLATARRSGMSLDVAKAQRAANDAGAPPPLKPAGEGDKTSPPDSPNVATALEALRAVLPATFIALYSTAVILLQNFTQAAGAEARATLQTSLARQFAEKPNELKAAFQALPVESPYFVELRVGFAVLAILLLAYFAYSKAQMPGKKRVLMEPAVTTLAFIAWALASPGTFLAAYLTANQLAATTISVAFGAALALYVVSETVLRKKQE